MADHDPGQPARHRSPSTARARRWPLAGQLLLGLLSILLAMWLLLPRITAVEHLANGSSGPVYPLWLVWSGGVNRLELDLQVGALTPRRWSVAVEGRLTALRINGHEVPLQNLLPEAPADTWRGFILDAAPWLQPGANHLEFTVETAASSDVRRPSGGLSFLPVPGWRLLLMWAGFMPWLLALARLFRLRREQILVLALALEILCVYCAGTPWNLRTHDVMLANGGHLAYITYIADHLALPLPTQGWTFYHPPLYYIAGAAAWRWANWLALPAPPVLQWLALTLWLVFLTASAAALRLTLRCPQPALSLATAVLALWPAGIIQSVAVGNDAALYASAAVAGWLLLRWWRSGSRPLLLGAAGAVAVALLCKSNAIVLAAALGLLLGLRLLRRPRRRRWIDAAMAAGLVGAGLLLSLGQRIWFYWHGELGDWLIANAQGLPQVLRVPVRLADFLPVELPTYLGTPWMDPFDPASGRANFWNYLMRSALSGEFSFTSNTARLIALLWGALLLGMMLLPLRAIGRCTRAQLWRDAPLLALGLLWLASLLALRIRVPYACSNDFRYILPVLVPFLVWVARSGMTARWILFGMVLSSPLFFLAAA
jgi:hypothetical protein